MSIQVYYSKQNDTLYTVKGKTVIHILGMKVTCPGQLKGAPFSTVGITGIVYVRRKSLPSSYVYIGEL